MNASLALPSLVSIAGLWVLVTWFYRDYRVDLFRERLFAIRDELFDMARTGRIEFNNPAYVALRTMLNGFIRFGDRVSVSWMLALSVAVDGDIQAEGIRDFDERWRTGVRSLPPDVRADLLALQRRLHGEFGEQIVFASPLFSIPFLILLVPVGIFLEAKQRVQRWLTGWSQARADAAAYAEGCLA